jgi:hypothetical protein
VALGFPLIHAKLDFIQELLELENLDEFLEDPVFAYTIYEIIVIIKCKL